MSLTLTVPEVLTSGPFLTGLGACITAIGGFLGAYAVRKKAKAEASAIISSASNQVQDNLNKGFSALIESLNKQYKDCLTRVAEQDERIRDLEARLDQLNQFIRDKGFAPPPWS
jgi:predicted ArsR family transcriptional regulator